jgi:holo-[acyl-carrier protein] synthase
MMIRLGTDIVHIPRIAAALDRFGDRFLQRVYTLAEQQDCGYIQPSTDYYLTPYLAPLTAQTSINQLAERWAAKEAVAKALSTGFRALFYTDIEIRRQPSGVPQVLLYGTAADLAASWGEGQWQLSLSHDRDYCIATALLVCD